jgi:hypothetical protein
VFVTDPKNTEKFLRNYYDDHGGTCSKSSALESRSAGCR